MMFLFGLILTVLIWVAVMCIRNGKRAILTKVQVEIPHIIKIILLLEEYKGKSMEKLSEKKDSDISKTMK